MPVTIRHARIAAITSGGPTQDLTVSGGPGTNPVAALFFMNRATTGLEAAHSQLCVGSTDGTNSRCVIKSCEDNVAITNTWQKALNDCVLMTIDPTTGTLDGRATFSSWGTDKVTISWSDFPAGAFFIDVILWFGTNINVSVGDFDGGVDTSKNVGFAPEQVFAFGCNAAVFTTSATTGSTADASLSIGVANKQNGVTSQGCVGFYDRDAFVLATSSGQSYSIIYSYGIIFDDAVINFADITLTSTGFNISGTGGKIGFLAISYNNQVTSKFNTLDTPTVTGTNPVTSVGFKPQFVFELQSFLTNYNIASSSNGAVLGLGIYTDAVGNALAQRTVGFSPGTTDCKSLNVAGAQNLRNKDSSSRLQATLTSFEDTGYTKNYSIVDATVRKSVYLAVSETIPHGWMAESHLLPEEGECVSNYG